MEDFHGLGSDSVQSVGAVSAALDAWSAGDHNRQCRTSAHGQSSGEIEIPSLDFGGRSNDRIAWDFRQFTQKIDHEQEEFNAALFEMRQIFKKPDHVSGRLEYSAMVGSSFVGCVDVSGLQKSELDNDQSSAAATRQERYDLNGRVVDSFIHSHPRILVGDQERPWWMFSPTDVANLKELSKTYGHEVVGYVLGPEGTVFRWKPNSGKVYVNSQGMWGEPEAIGKFDRDGNYVPIRQSVVNGNRVYERDKIIRKETIDGWNHDNHWGAASPQAQA